MLRPIAITLLPALAVFVVGCPDQPSALDQPATVTTPHPMVKPPNVELGLPAQPGPRDAKGVIETVWKNLDKGGHACPRGFDYGAGGGMRTFGCKLLSMVAYESLGRMAGVPVFLSGPHSATKLDFENDQDFGHYNPAFVRWAVDKLVPAATNPRLGIATGLVYEKHVRSLARTFYLVVLERNREPKRFIALVKKYQARLERKEKINASHEEYLDYMASSPFNRLAQAHGVSLDELRVNTTTGFWVRRAEDGTDHQWLAGLEKLLSVYDGEFLRQAKVFAKNPPPVEQFEEMEGDYAEEMDEPFGAPEVTGDTIRDGWLALDETRNTCSEFDYFPEGGMRIFACHGFSLVPYAHLVATAKLSPFVSGPHSDNRLVLDHKTKFGHYDPAFVRWAVDNLIPGAGDEAFRNQTQPLYDQKVRPLARTFMVVWRDIQRRPERFQAEVKKLKAALADRSLEEMWYEDYYDYLDADSSAETDFSSDGNVVKTCVAFWMRREIDGTDEEFARGLSKLMKTYDPVF